MKADLPDKVLVVRLGAIGDVVNALVFASALARLHPGVEIGWVAHPLARPLVEGHPHVTRVHVWERERGLAGFRAVLREVRAEGYGLAVDLQRITKSSALARLSGAARVLGYDRARAKELSWLWTRERIPAGGADAHMVEQYLEFARYLGADAPQAEHHLPEPPEARAWADELLERLGAGPVLLNLGATKPANRWPAERFGELAAGLLEAGAGPVCLVGGPGDGDLRDRAVSAAGNRAAGLEDLVGHTDLAQLGALAARSRLFVSGDTGPMHIAVARGAPTLALFGAADPARTGPWPDGTGGVSVLRGRATCAPCNRRHCNQPSLICMEDLGVDAVLREALSLSAP